jgi:phage terminase large subunit-like protein
LINGIHKSIEPVRGSTFRVTQYSLSAIQTFALLLTGIHDFIPGACRGWWSIWLALTGRGWGKTRTRTEWVHEHAVAGSLVALRWCRLNSDSW